ncbi:glycosyltransferase family 4 protein [Azospirillum halopraeferens]|uniref:glycosyltransferase family 4 protein n=1 Tax=Azospirillum halopraeferens TaxID=34010 RepID=UPI0003F88E13|nr:glycosyltransferase family 4 protein [Azospirillum halopraeferens]
MAPATGVDVLPGAAWSPNDDCIPARLLERLEQDRLVALVRNPFARLVHLFRSLQEGDPACRALARALRWPAYGGDASFDAFVRILADLPAYELDWLIPVQASALCIGDIAVDQVLCLDGDRKRLSGPARTGLAGSCPPISGATATRIVAMYEPDFELFGYDRDPGQWRRSPERAEPMPGTGCGGAVRQTLKADVARAGGEMSAADTALRAVLALGETGVRCLPEIRAALAEMLIDAGRLVEADALLRPGPAVTTLAPGWRRARARLLQRQDRHAEAAHVLIGAFRRCLPDAADAALLGDAIAGSGDVALAAVAGHLLVDVAGTDAQRLAVLAEAVVARLAPARPTRAAMEFLDALAGPGGDGRLAARLHDSIAVPVPVMPAQDSAPVASPQASVRPVKAHGALVEMVATLEQLREHKRQQLLRHTLARYPHLFQADHYVRQVGEAPMEGMDPREHFIRSGSKAGGYSPNPFFSYSYYLPYRECPPDTLVDSLVHFAALGAASGNSPGQHFGTSRYVAEHPDLAGTPANPLDHCFAQGDPDKVPAVLPDHVRVDLDWLCRLDPGLNGVRTRLLGGPDRAADEMALFGEVYSRLHTAIGRGFTHLIVAPWLWHPGGAERIGLLLLRLLIETQGAENVVMLGLDLHTVEKPAVAPGARLVSFTDVSSHPSHELRVELLRRLIIDFQPKCVFNLNSAAAWTLMRRHICSLAKSANFYAIIFSNAASPSGEPIGYSYFLAECLPFMKGVIADNSSIVRSVRELQPLLNADMEKIHVVYTPLSDVSVSSPRARAKPRQSLWVSRFAPEKRMDVLAEIARRMPDRRHLIYGSRIDGIKVNLEPLQALDNVTIRGRFRSLADIPADECDVFIYTSDFDGLPIVLLEATAMGLPIVAPDVGGISDLVNADTGWLVSGPDAVDEYVEAIREIEAKPRLARRKVLAAQKILRERHDWQSYHRSLAALPGFIKD